jgi:hypothetical protein
MDYENRRLTGRWQAKKADQARRCALGLALFIMALTLIQLFIYGTLGNKVTFLSQSSYDTNLSGYMQYVFDAQTLSTGFS